MQYARVILKKDNSTIRHKILLRQKLLSEFDDPFILEAFAGDGRIYENLYKGFGGIAIEKDFDKIIKVPRPGWILYNADNNVILGSKLLSIYDVDFIDLDAYGDPWLAIQSLMDSEYFKIKKRLGIVVTDGLRQSLKMNIGWKCGTLQNEVAKHGNDRMYKNYIDICHEKLSEFCIKKNAHINKWLAYYCGHAQQMTHFAAVLST